MMMSDGSVIQMHEMHATTPTEAFSEPSSPPMTQQSVPLFQQRQPSPEIRQLSRASSRHTSRQPSRSASRLNSRQDELRKSFVNVLPTAAAPPTSQLSQATSVPAFHGEHGLIVPPRLVRFWAWCSIYILFALIWISSTIFAFVALSSIFWTPETASSGDPVSRSWVQAGWGLNWIALVLQLLLLFSIIRSRSPFNSFVTMGSLVQLTLAALAAICHSNSLAASQVLSPLSDSRAIVIQLEWLSVALMLLSFICLLFHTPRRVIVPVMAQLMPRSKAELMSLSRQLQGEIESLSHLWESNRAREVATFGGNGANERGAGVPPSPMHHQQQRSFVQQNPTAAMINPMSSFSRSKSNAIRSARGMNSNAWIQNAMSPAHMDSVQVDNSYYGGRPSFSQNSAPPPPPAAAPVFLPTTDSRTHRKGMTQGDRDIAKMAMALRSEFQSDQMMTMNTSTTTPRGDQFADPHAVVSMRGTKSRKSRRKSGESSTRSMRSKKNNGVQSLGQNNDFFAQAQRIIQQQQQEAWDAEPI